MTCKGWYKQKFDRFDVYCTVCGYLESVEVEERANTLAGIHSDKLVIAAQEVADGTPSR